MGSLFKFISEQYPTIGVIIVVSVIVFLAAKYHFSIQHTKKKVDELPCDAHGKKLDVLEQKIDNHTEKLDKIGSSLEIICKALVVKKIIDPLPMLQKFSPYSLTEAGKKLLEMSGGKACIDSNLDFFITKIEEMSPQTAYDAEKFAESAIWRNADNPIFNGIKDYIFLAPEILTIDGVEMITSMYNVKIAMSIYLRDKYFEVHPELLPTNVFAHVEA